MLPSRVALFAARAAGLRKATAQAREYPGSSAAAPSQPSSHQAAAAAGVTDGGAQKKAKLVNRPRGSISGTFGAKPPTERHTTLDIFDF